MKLIFCPHCQDMFKMQQVHRACACGKSAGQYAADGLHCTITGSAIPIGIENTSLVDALESRPQSGKGKRFNAFVIPVAAPTVDDHGSGATLQFQGSQAKARRDALLEASLNGTLFSKIG